MDAAFLVVVGKPPGGPGEPHRHVVESLDSPHLGFKPHDHVPWHDRSDRVLFGAWQLQAARDGVASWHIDDEQVVMTTGFVRWRKQSWLPEGQWAAQLASAMGRASCRDLAERLRGVFDIVRASADGEVTFLTDPLGLRCVYYGESDDVVAVSSKAGLVAEVLAYGQRAPPVTL